MFDRIAPLINDLKRYLEVCENQVVAADKEDRSPVTIADVGVQSIINQWIAAEFSRDMVIAEEERKDLPTSVLDRSFQLLHEFGSFKSSDQFHTALDYVGDQSSSSRWYIDPIDGTKGYLRDDQYAIAIARYTDGSPVQACLVCPRLAYPDLGSDLLGTVFYWDVNIPAFQAHLQDLKSRIVLKADTNKSAMLRSVEKSHGDFNINDLIMRKLGIKDQVAIDSQAKYGILARGEGSIYLRVLRDGNYKEKPWDHAAGSALVSATGGIVSDIEGNPLEFTRQAYLNSGRGIVATRGEEHQQVLKALTEIL